MRTKRGHRDRTDHGRVALFAAALACAVAAPAAAQQDGQDDDIVVTGQRAIDQAAAHQFVNEVTVEVEGQLARFHDPICPGVTGLKDAPALEIADRLSRVADAAGLPPAAEGCDPNLLVMVVEDGRKAVEQLQGKGALRSLADKERRRLLSAEGPVLAFSDTQLQSDDGMVIGTSTNTASGGGNSPGSPLQRNLGVRTGSMIKEPTQQVTLRTIVILEADALMGKTPLQVADYAAMWALGGVRQTGGGFGERSILSLFEPGAAPPESLTAFDLAFLKSLYATAPNQDARLQTQQIAENMTDVLVTP